MLIPLQKVLTAEGKLEVRKLSAVEIPAFVEEEVKDNEDLLAAVAGGEGSGGASQPEPEIILWENLIGVQYYNHY